MLKPLVTVGLAALVIGCATARGATSNVQDQRTTNLAAAHRLYDNFLKGDINSVLAGMSDDVVWIVPGDSTLPYAGTRNGKAEWMKYLTGLGTVDLKAFEPQEFLADGDKVVVFGKERYVVKATGKTVEEDWAQLMTFRDGKLVRFRSYDDTGAAMAGYR